VSEFEGKGRLDGTSQQHSRHDEQGWAHRPHEDLVKAFRGLLLQRRLSYGEFAPNFPPAAIIRGELDHKTGPDIVYDPQRKEFFTKLRDAWDVIAYEHYQWQPGELAGEQISARWDLSVRHFAAKRQQEPHPEIIRLDPKQVRILDALAEAADIPHQRGQTEITIPDHLRHEAEESLQEWKKKHSYE